MIKMYPRIDDQNHIFEEISYERLNEVLKEGKHYIYFGFPTCPWCQVAVKYMNRIGKESGIDKILYFNTKELKINNLTEFQKLEQFLELEHLYVPDLTYIENGEVIEHYVGTTYDHRILEDENGDKYLPKMTDEQINILIDNYKKIFSLR